MPIYEYRCTKCHHTFELYQAVGDAAPNCPQCGSPSRKVYASVGLIFKGSGFHATDYRKPPASANGESQAEKTPQKAASDKPAEKSPMSETKPAPPSTS